MARLGPTNGQLAVAGFVGIVLGALGGGFARAVALFLGVVMALGIWRIVNLLTILVDRREPLARREPAATRSATYGARQ